MEDEEAKMASALSLYMFFSACCHFLSSREEQREEGRRAMMGVHACLRVRVGDGGWWWRGIKDGGWMELKRDRERKKRDLMEAEVVGGGGQRQRCLPFQQDSCIGRRLSEHTH